MDKGFESKVAGLVSVTQGLDVARILVLRRMTLIDPETLHWASARQLELIFNVILEKALERTDPTEIQAASQNRFDPLLPPGDEGERERERELLTGLAGPILAGLPPLEDDTPEAAEEEEEEPAIDAPPMDSGDFPTLFDETIARHLRVTLAALACTGSRPHIPHPFIVAPHFRVIYEKVVRKYVLPSMRSARRIKELGSSRNWQDKGSADRLLGMVLGDGSRDNPILHYWDSRWETFEPSRAAAKGKGTVRPQDDPWQVFKDDAAKHEYIPPYYTDIPLLQRIMRLDGEVIADAWSEIAQIYQQEFHPTSKADQARTGAFRDALLRSFDKLDDNGADLLVIRAFYDLPKVDKMFLKTLIQSLGRSDTERNRKAPLLIAFFNDLPR